MSDVVLSAAMRNNLLSLTKTQNLIDSSQLKLSTGKKVNSALDNPQSYFASQSLTNRAGDLTKLLDGISQSIEVIKAADNGVTALTSLVNQAQAVVQSAQTAVASGSQVAQATGDADLSGKDDLSKLNGWSTGAAITFSVTDPSTGAPVAKLNNYGGTTAQTTLAISVSANDSTDDLVNKINNVVDGATNQHLLSASLDSSGHLQVKSLNGASFSATFATTAATDASSQAFAASIGFGSIAKTQAITSGGTAANVVGFTASASNSLTSKALYTGANVLAQASSLIGGLKGVDGSTVRTSAIANGDSLTITVAGKTSGNLFGTTGSTQTIQGVVDAINHDSAVSSLVSASFDATNGQISLTAKDATATDISFTLQTTDTTANSIDLFGSSALTTGATANDKNTSDIRFGAAAGQLASLQTQYNGIRDQIDALVTNGDTGYQGTNLLNGDNLKTTFNEDRSSSLTTKGASFNSKGLGISSANFSSASTVNAAQDEISGALSKIRDFGSSLSSDLSVIQTRQTFTNATISTLQEGSDNLTNVDQNTESATLLALQTRQSLGVSALSLASQSAQSVLRLFQ